MVYLWVALGVGTADWQCILVQIDEYMCDRRMHYLSCISYVREFCVRYGWQTMTQR